jgi:hypothetical protein
MCTNPGTTAGQDLQVFGPTLHLTGYANVTPFPYFSYDSSTGTLTITGTSGNDRFQFNQSTHSSAGGQLTTTYTFTVNGATVTYTSAQLSQVIVNGGGGNDTAVLMTNDTYVGTDGKTHETLEQVILTAGGGTLQKLDATGNNPVNFLSLTGFNNVYAYMGHGDTGLLNATQGVATTFVSTGSYAYVTTPGTYTEISGARYVYAYSVNASDIAYQYDGNGASAYVASGHAYSFMTGSDGGASFFNEAVGFTHNYGIARHPHVDTAIFYDSPANDVFVGQTSYSFLYSDNAQGGFAYFDGAQGFAHVYAYSFVGGLDAAYNYDSHVNTVVGFNRPIQTATSGTTRH